MTLVTPITIIVRLACADRGRYMAIVDFIRLAAPPMVSGAMQLLVVRDRLGEKAAVAQAASSIAYPKIHKE
jgi:hypothetical protein